MQEYKQPLEFIDSNQEQEWPESEEIPEDDFFKALEPITRELGRPLDFHRSLALHTIRKRLRTHFGRGREGLGRFSAYCVHLAANPVLMGKKTMKDGRSFSFGIGNVLSEKMINDYMEKKGFFTAFSPYSPRKQEHYQQETSKKEYTEEEQYEKVFLPLDEVLRTAQTPFDQGLKESLYKALGEVIYRSWMYRMNFVGTGIDSYGNVMFTVKNKFAEEYIQNHFGSIMSKLIA